MQCDVRFNRFEETVPNYIAEHHKPSYNHASDGNGPTSTQKKKTQSNVHATCREGNRNNRGNSRSIKSNKKTQRRIVFMRLKSHYKSFMIVIKSHGFSVPGGNRVVMAIVGAGQAPLKILQSLRGRMLNAGVSPRWCREACSSFSQLFHKADTQSNKMCTYMNTVVCTHSKKSP